MLLTFRTATCGNGNCRTVSRSTWRSGRARCRPSRSGARFTKQWRLYGRTMRERRPHAGLCGRADGRAAMQRTDVAAHRQLAGARGQHAGRYSPKLGTAGLKLNPHAAFAACYVDNGRGERVYPLRARQDDFDVSVIAQAFGGGGHRAAAGFKLNPGAPAALEFPAKKRRPWHDAGTGHHEREAGVEIPAKSVINFDSGFKHKLLCDGPTFSTGTACAYTCSFRYVPAMMRRDPHLKGIEQPHEEHRAAQEGGTGGDAAATHGAGASRNFTTRQTRRVIYLRRWWTWPPIWTCAARRWRRASSSWS